MASNRSHAESAPRRACRGIDVTRILQVRCTANANWREIAWATATQRRRGSMELVRLLPNPPVRAEPLPAARVAIKVPLGDGFTELKRAFVGASQAHRKLHRARDPLGQEWWTRATHGHGIEGFVGWNSGGFRRRAGCSDCERDERSGDRRPTFH